MLQDRSLLSIQRTGGRSRWSVQRGSAVGAIDIVGADHMLALRTVRGQFVVATRAEVESRLDGVAALRTGAAQRLPQNKVQNHAQAIGNEDGDDGPQDAV